MAAVGILVYFLHASLSIINIHEKKLAGNTHICPGPPTDIMLNITTARDDIFKSSFGAFKKIFDAGPKKILFVNLTNFDVKFLHKPNKEMTSEIRLQKWTVLPYLLYDTRISPLYSIHGQFIFDWNGHNANHSEFFRRVFGIAFIKNRSLGSKCSEERYRFLLERHTYPCIEQPSKGELYPDTLFCHGFRTFVSSDMLGTFSVSSLRDKIESGRLPIDDWILDQWTIKYKTKISCAEFNEVSELDETCYHSNETTWKNVLVSPCLGFKSGHRKFSE